MSNRSESGANVPAKSRRFRFGLRGLFVAVLALAIGLSLYLQLRVVYQRRSLLDTLRTNPRVVDISVESDFVYGTERLEGRGFKVSIVRRWLGDEGVLSISMSGEPSKEERERIQSIFPEATLKTGFPGPGTGYM